MSSLAKVQKTRDIKKPIDIKVARHFHLRLPAYPEIVLLGVCSLKNHMTFSSLLPLFLCTTPKCQLQSFHCHNGILNINLTERDWHMALTFRNADSPLMK